MNVSQVAVAACFFRHELTEFRRNDSHNVRCRGNYEESKQWTVHNVCLHLIGGMCKRKSDQHEIEAWLCQMGVEMCHRRRKRRNVFGKKVICILDPPIQVRYFIVSLIGEILLVRMIDKSCSEIRFTLLITDNSHNTFYG